MSSSSCEIVANDYDGEWAGMPACRTCYDVHNAAGVVALAAHVKSTASIRKELEESYRVLLNVRHHIERGMEAIGL